MRKLKNWLLPALTCLAVLAAALLPPRLSQARDRQLLGQVHTEAVSAEELRPPAATQLQQRLDILLRWKVDFGVDAITQELEPEDTVEGPGQYSGEDLTETALFALTRLMYHVPMLEDLIYTSPANVTGKRLILQDYKQATGLSANFLDLRWRDQRPDSKVTHSIRILLDEETGLIVALYLQHTITSEGKDYDVVTHGAVDLPVLRELALWYLEYLGIDASLRFTVDNISVSDQVEKGPVVYRFVTGTGGLTIEPCGYEEVGETIVSPSENVFD